MKFSPVAYAKSHVPPPGHQRTYLQAYVVAMLANGVFLPIYVLYLIRIVHVSHSKTALAIALAGLIGLPLTLLAGDLADRLGPRRVVLVGLTGSALGMGSYVFISGFWSLLAVVASMNVFAYTTLASEGALMRRIGGDDTITFRNQVQTLGNIGLAAGAGIAGIGIVIGSHWAYRAMFLGIAATYVVVIAITLRLPDYKPLPKPESPGRVRRVRWIVLRDEAFLAYALISAGLTMATFVDSQLLPIWIVAFTRAPHWTIVLVFGINTVITILLQMRLSQNVRSMRQAGRAMLRCGITLMLGCLVLAAMHGRSPWLATVLVIAGASLLAIAQIWMACGRFVLEFSLPPAHAQGQYDGLLNTAMTFSISAAPLVLIWAIFGQKFAGWAVLGGFFLLLGIMGPELAAWGERTRPDFAGPDEAAAEPGEAAAVMASAGMGEG